jgi:benzoylformate decarboxylase/acetolactate synthase-1/2/3 large subunit
MPYEPDSDHGATKSPQPERPQTSGFAPYDAPSWGSDVMADAIRALSLKYVSLNPGSSYRGLHDSLVNYAGDQPKMIECPHEKIAVGIAHGYAKATGEPMGVILHNVVGLLHGAMGIYYAYIDRTPIVVFGGAGPAAHDRRRPNIDWIHSANVQGNAVRDFTKWDHEPRSIESVPDTIARAYRIAMSEPRGPVYVALDAGLQEQPLTEPITTPDFTRLAVPSGIGPDPAALRRLADRLLQARRPVIVAGNAGRDPRAFDYLIELAELVGIGVIDVGLRLNFPNRHPLCATGTTALEAADCVFFLDVKDMGKPTQVLDSTTRTVRSRIRPDAVVLDLGFNDIAASSWSEDYAALIETDLQVTADTRIALPLLLEECRTQLTSETPTRRAERESWKAELGRLHSEAWQGWQTQAAQLRDASPVATSRLATEVWEVVRHHDWVLTANTVGHWAKRIWDFDAAYRHPGNQLGTATQIGVSLGVALAHKGTGRLVVDLQPDGDLMFDAGALWVAAYYELPLLVVMFNNRAYFNDWEHQERLARQRGTPLDRAHIGMEIDSPAPDFASLARSFDWYAEGPITGPDQVRGAVQRAADHVLGAGKPALVDVVCQKK